MLQPPVKTPICRVPPSGAPPLLELLPPVLPAVVLVAPLLEPVPPLCPLESLLVPLPVVARLVPLLEEPALLAAVELALLVPVEVPLVPLTLEPPPLELPVETPPSAEPALTFPDVSQPTTKAATTIEAAKLPHRIERGYHGGRRPARLGGAAKAWCGVPQDPDPRGVGLVICGPIASLLTEAAGSPRPGGRVGRPSWLGRTRHPGRGRNRCPPGRGSER